MKNQTNAFEFLKSQYRLNRLASNDRFAIQSDDHSVEVAALFYFEAEKVSDAIVKLNDELRSEHRQTVSARG